MTQNQLDGLRAEISALCALRNVGRVASVKGSALRVSGLSAVARLGDRVRIHTRDGPPRTGEVLQLEQASILVLPDDRQTAWRSGIG